MGQILLDDFYNKTKKRLCVAFILSLFFGSALGYIFYKGSPFAAKIQQEQAILTQIQSSLNKGGYMDTLNRLQNAGQGKFIENMLAKMQDGEEGSKEKIEISALFGVDAFRQLVARAKGENGDDIAPQGLGQEGGGLFPDITLEGAIYSAKGRATTVMKVAGRPQVWKWEFQDGKWICINPVPGFGIADAQIAPGLVEFSMFPLTRSNTFRKYSFGDNVAGQLAQFQYDNENIEGIDMLKEGGGAKVAEETNG